MKKKIRVLIVDDSALVRGILEKGLSLDPGIEIVGTAADPFIARDKILELKPDVLTLDVEMPRMDGVEFLHRLMPNFPIPTIICSSLTPKGGHITLDALSAGAVDVVTKPEADVSRGLTSMLGELRTKIKIASTSNVSHWKHKKTNGVKVSTKKVLKGSTDKVIAIGASTGGTEAIAQVITQLPVTTPGVVIVQHMPEKFTKMFADRLNQNSMMTVKEACDGDRIMQGTVLIAPGGFHMKVKRSGGIYQVICGQGEKVNGHCPSVEVLFNSVAEYVGVNAVGIILTGMGGDGAKGMLNMRQAGAKTIGQDERSCVVYGMPKVAYEIGAVEKQISIDEIADATIEILNGAHSKRSHNHV